MKKFTKAFLSTVLSLTVAASFMGSAVPVNAQEASARAIEGPHNMKTTTRTWYKEANSEYHFVYKDTVMDCQDPGCNVVITDTEQIGYETHEFRGAVQPSSRWSCIHCGYTE